MKKRTILIFALSRSPWIGGVYYKKNITRMILCNTRISEKYNIVVMTNDKYADVFATFNESVEVVKCPNKIGYLGAMVVGIKCLFKYKIKYVFPIKPYPFFRLLDITPVSWIADFQHNHYPDFFDKKEIKTRNSDFAYMTKAENPLVVSSENALKDFRKFYSKERKNVHVVHFTSCISDEINALNRYDEEQILDKYGLLGQKYIAICNQFWKHKNHIVVFRAIKKMTEIASNNIKFVFTGEPSDRRNPLYYQELVALINDEDIKDKIKILGFIDRTEQLCIMKNSIFLIQPSLFEGWGTVVEDAKVLGKTILLSNIEVHEEQKNENCVLFRAEDVEDLACTIRDMLNSLKEKCIQCEDKTIEYAKALEDIFI